jgi:hypothetical protein
MKTYKQCFVGTEAVDFLVSSGIASSREKAAQIGKAIQKAGFFSHVTNAHEFEDEYLFYRFSQNGDNDDANYSDTSSVQHSGMPEDELADVTLKFKQGVRIADRRYRLTVYKKCFVGSEAVDFLITSGAASSRAEGL